MNILFVQNDLNPTSGGIARVSNLLCKFFMNQGYDVCFLYYLSDCDEIDNLHKHKYQLTMDEKYMYGQVGDFVKQIPGGGKLCNYTSTIFSFNTAGVYDIARGVWI